MAIDNSSINTHFSEYPYSVEQYAPDIYSIAVLNNLQIQSSMQHENFSKVHDVVLLNIDTTTAVSSLESRVNSARFVC